MRSLLAIALTTALCACCGGSTPASGCADPQVIDDMEDNDRFICGAGSRHGAWYTATTAAARTCHRAATSPRR